MEGRLGRVGEGKGCRGNDEGVIVDEGLGR